MIDTVTVMAGEADFTRAARQHAQRMARWFQATLDVIPAVGRGAPIGDAPAPYAPLPGPAPRIAARCDARGARSRTAPGRGNLLVVGLPAGSLDRGEPTVGAVLHAHVQWPDRAARLVLAVSQPPGPCRMVLVDYRWGAAGKAALRAGAEVAMRANAALTVFCVDEDRGYVEVLSAVAERYLRELGVPSIATITRAGHAWSARAVAHAARLCEADLVVVGPREHGLLELLDEPQMRGRDDVSPTVRRSRALAREQLLRMAS